MSGQQMEEGSAPFLADSEGERLEDSTGHFAAQGLPCCTAKKIALSVLLTSGAALLFHASSHTPSIAATWSSAGIMSAQFVPPPAQTAAQAGGPRECNDEEAVSGGCPSQWLYEGTGGYFCPATKGCSEWTDTGGEFDKEACPDQCTLGMVYPHKKTTPKPDAAPSGDEDSEGNADSGAAPPPNDGKIHPCDDGEAECPDEWAFAETGGYFCRSTKGCSPWSKTGGAFQPDACPDQCTVGNTPTTITKTTTSLTVTTTYPGMGIKLYCWSLAQPGYEFDILRRQHEMNAGIFACDDQVVLNFDKLSIGEGPDKIETWSLERVACGVSKDGTSANTLQFMKAWDVIKSDKRWERNDWVVKVDPDAVLLPDRLRIHLNPHNGGNVYIRNCNKPGMPEGTMMFGSMEAISHAALSGYYANFDTCKNDVPWQQWGEDLFMGKCLEKIGSGFVEDFSISQDGVCNGVWCSDSTAAVFHPMKDVPAWEGCWNAAVQAR